MSDKKQQQSSKQLYRVSDLIAKGQIDLDDLANLIPGILHINSRKDLAIEYISQEGCDLIRYSKEELQEMGAEVLRKHQSEHALTVIYPKILSEFRKGDSGLVIPFFQDWRHQPEDKPFYLFTASKILNKDQLISITLFPKNIEQLCRKVNKVFGVNETLDRYFPCYQQLTKREKQILTLLGKELSRKQISQHLFIDTKTVKKHCENIFRKLGTNKRTEIERIALAFTTL
ncbi:response regulator transcription factor [Flagellimonas myxillae]|uniref:response regulator transcription factor n=1 Tax=Flagellimonas myxillae TaxID=2942214 RepID=UPI00201FAC9B|nr:helix-turn-helix transcriptional regulator [Muricauda myxillae]MCL6265961.1 helix-turn-helix transcriptional regulator [Muricauda myxillae]